ncbi:MAG: LemA family protein [Spirochaetaceae bacterium]|nr:LemA family protein [Spirochaetaceae bacterium]
MMNKKVLWIVVPIAIIVIIVWSLFSWYINTRNQLIHLEENTNAGWAEIDNQLQRRNDLIPNLVATVRGYAAHEHDIFTSIADARSRLMGAGGVAETAAASGQLEGALSRLLMIVENYPQLKADQNFIRLQDELAGTENRLAVARRRYNEGVREFNARIRFFPANIIAGHLGLERKPYFEIPEAAREAPVVSF